MNILHLTDLHFSRDIPEEKEQKKWNEILVKVIKICSEKKINVLAITGDFTCHGAEEEFVRAERFIQKLIGKIGLKKEQVLMCPGNHDADTEEENSSFEHYENFVRRFYGEHQPAWKIKRKKKNSENEKEQVYAFITMNTCHKTSLELYERASLTEEDCEKIRSLEANDYGIVLMHHQPEAIINQEAFTNIVKDDRMKLILSGHQHMSLTREYKAENVVIINGMAVTPHCQWMAAGCQIIKIKKDETIKIRQIDL